ncbi:IPT/TIG domain-containing protein [Micropruina sp.]|uniref:IPT/TIG domain-containing protein n=1 Tax=Micropruina sp. TaxID=2737536 RepID=UPI0039E6659F
MVYGLTALIVSFASLPSAPTARAEALWLGASPLTPALAPAAQPTVSNISPARGPAGGKTMVTLTGTGLAGAKKVLFGGRTGQGMKIISDTKLTVIAPAGSGTVPIRVATKTGATSPASARTAYRYVSAPKVTKLSPTSGGTGGKTTVTITGKNFVDVDKILFAKSPGTDIRVISESKLTVSAPARSAGIVDVRVVTEHGTSAKTPKGRFRFVAPPAISTVRPTTGPEIGGTKVTITGSGFTGVTQVRFGSVPGSKLKVTSASKLTVTAPAGTPGTVDVLVSGRYGTSAKSSAARYTYTSSCPRRVIEVSGSITEDTTWKADCGTVYHVTGTLWVEGTEVGPRQIKPAKLTVPAGAIVKFDDSASLQVSSGELVVEGTLTKPAVFTSIHDDTVGGDTNGNGAQTKPKARSWGGIIGAPDGGAIRANGLAMRYGGDITGSYGGSMLGISPSTVRVTSSTLTDSGSIIVRPVFPFIAYDPIVIAGNTLTSSGTIDVYSEAPADDSTPIRVSDNSVVGSISAQPAISITAAQLRPSDFTGNTGSNNKVNAFRLYGTLVENWTLPTTGLPYIVGTSFRAIGAPWDSDGLHIAKGVTLTVPAGAVLKFQRITQQPLAFVGIAGEGSLIVNGTAANPVIFTSIHDDTAGGDTNGNGNATQPTAGDWDGLAIRDTGTVNASFLDLRYLAD